MPTAKRSAVLAPFTYPCFCTRKDIAEEIARAMEAPHLTCRSRTGPTVRSIPAPAGISPPDERAAAHGARRLLCRAAGCGEGGGGCRAARISSNMAMSMRSNRCLFGDVVLARKDMPASYHLAVVVDDAFQGVTLVTRGEDLLPAAHVQRLLQALLGCPAPAYAHHRLILDKDGRKFSKRDQSVTLRGLARGGRHAGRG